MTTERIIGVDAEFLGVTEIPSFTEFEGTIVGGLSGITGLASGDFLAVSDDRSDIRAYTLSIDLGDGTLEDGDVVIQSLLRIEDLDALVPDPEGIAIGPDGTTYISSERDVVANPAIYTLNGADLTGALPVGAKFQPNPDGSQGVRNNLGFESLTISPDGTTLWAATESALAQDGERANTETGSAARIVKYDLATGLPVAEYVYEVDPIAFPPNPEGAFADSGLVEMLAIDDQGTFIALERSFSIGAPDRGYTGKLFLVETQAATNVIGFNSFETTVEDGELEINVDEIARKTLIADLADFGVVVDNIEGLALGPQVDGKPTLIIASDDNFSAFGPQATQFIALSLDLETIPTIEAVAETPNELRFNNEFDPVEGPDPDDPAIYVDGDTAFVVTAMKNGGLRVYDLDGAEVSRLEPEGVRYNNVDILHDVEINGREIDLVVASDRANDTLAIFRIRPDGTLRDLTSRKAPDTIFGVDDGEATAYGLAAYQDGDRNFVFVTQADGAQIAQLEIKVKGNRFTFEEARMLTLPVPADEDPADFQSEGLVIDRDTGIGYVTVEEELGLLAFDAAPELDSDFRVVADIDSPFFGPDLEGVSIYYGADGEGLILVSSQGNDTFNVFDRATEEYLGSFAYRAGAVDSVTHSDGLDIYSGPLPGFDRGLLVTQDGSNDPEFVIRDPEDAELQNYNVNFKYSDFGDVLDLFASRTVEATAAYDRFENPTGRDVFVFEAGDSTWSARDRIEDFTADDAIDLSAFGFTQIVTENTGFNDTDVQVVEQSGWVRVAGGAADDRFVLRVDGDIDDVIDGLIL